MPAELFFVEGCVKNNGPNELFCFLVEIKTKNNPGVKKACGIKFFVLLSFLKLK